MHKYKYTYIYMYIYIYIYTHYVHHDRESLEERSIQAEYINKYIHI